MCCSPSQWTGSSPAPSEVTLELDDEADLAVGLVTRGGHRQQVGALKFQLAALQPGGTQLPLGDGTHVVGMAATKAVVGPKGAERLDTQADVIADGPGSLGGVAELGVVLAGLICERLLGDQVEEAFE